jgi:cyclophilin family peptidyl-prolyl cis-trans isomerase
LLTCYIILFFLRHSFGPGPHYATFNLGIPGMRGTQQFTIEFASLQHMPVAVNQFLQQVKRNLWKDASFYLKAQHVTMARPGLQAKAEFSSSLLQHIPFPEYSDAMPHDEYTLGLNNDQPSGRPDFYINMMDNRIPHGPRGHQRDGSAEPCFAKIILGKEAVDAIRQLPNSDNDPFLLQQAVQIKGIDFVSDIRKVAGGAAYLAANK